MIISLIAALTVDHVIGKKNIVPWFFPADVQWFKYHTLYKPVIMGRKTFESINKKPLLNRLNIVLSRNLLNSFDGIFVVDNLGAALSITKNAYEVMIVGGGMIYKKFLPFAQRLYLTYIHSVISVDGDVWFPDFNINEWKTIFNIFFKTTGELSYTLNFKILERF